MEVGRSFEVLGVLKSTHVCSKDGECHVQSYNGSKGLLLGTCPAYGIPGV
ncbi:hypothetical protein F2Q69_00022493 [Brassica cretica]|uniref:Uncharacterized protein n=1 Tax=Brassica cretica TaxID=69181 RepID=A0A8S9QDH3_BRACR|nr:hypothetical protein F2Q69_00022493 [Brassica cretica]